MTRKLSAEKAAIKIVVAIREGAFKTPAEVVEAHPEYVKGQELATNELGEPKSSKEEAGKPSESDKSEKPGTARGRGSGTVVHSRIG